MAHSIRNLAMGFIEKNPEWREIQACVDDLIEKKLLNREKETNIHNEYSSLKHFIDNNLKKWDDETTQTQQRWIEVFGFMKSNSLSFENFALLIEYSFSIPGKLFAFSRNWLFSSYNKYL